MMPFGRFFGFLWFFMLFLAAITSSLSMLQPVIAFFEEGLGLKRHASVAFLMLITALGGGFVVYFSKDLKALDTMDFWVGTMAIFVLAMIQSFIYGWVLGIDKGEREAHVGAHLRIPRFVQYILKFVTPVYLVSIFVGVLWFSSRDYFESLTKNRVAGMSVAFITIVFLFLLLLTHIAGKRWETEGRFAEIENEK
jgi:SNF family Na+-dependent transporter